MPPASLTARDVLARAQEVVSRRRAAEVEDLELALDWADLHGDDPQSRPGALPASKGGHKLGRVGGDGTPQVQDLCFGELAIARCTSVTSARATVADALDLRHRLPLFWRAVRDLRCEPWVARRVARLSRALTRTQAAVVDAAVTAAVAEAPSRLLAVAEAKVIEADVARAQAAAARQRRRCGVWVSDSDDLRRTGEETHLSIRAVYARMPSGDVTWLDLTLDEVADLLAGSAELRATHHPELPEEPSRDELRAAALGWLARPHDLAELLGELDEQSMADVRRRRRGNAVVYVHLHETALRGAAAVARVEALGPWLVSELTGLLRHSNVTLAPVIDLNGGHSVNGYEHPTAVEELTLLRMVGDVFPHASARVNGHHTTLDSDHPRPYEPDGPPGQTGDHNHAPLGRHHHRAKTHLGYSVRQLGNNRYLWRTPHGLTRVVDQRGTHVVTMDEATRIELLYEPPPSLQT